MAFVASAFGAVPVLWLRTMEEPVARPLPGTENAEQPFWSPDSKWVGFFSQGKLRKIPVAGGPLEVIAEGIGNPRGGSWGPDDTIIYSDGSSPLRRVSSAGGTIAIATTPDTSEVSHRWPQFLPDGGHFLFSVRSGVSGKTGIYAGDGVTKKLLVPDVISNGLYAAPGYLLYVDQGTLFGQVFDADRLELSGVKFTVAQEVGRATSGLGAFSVSLNGKLAHAKTMSPLGRLTWFDRLGNPLNSVTAVGDYPDFRLSPDNTQLAATLVDPKTYTSDIWLKNLARDDLSQLTFGPGGVLNASAVWSPDGQRILFRANPGGITEFYERRVAGGTSADVPANIERAGRAAQMASLALTPTDWSSDGRNGVIFSMPTLTSGYDLWLLPMVGDRQPSMFLTAPGDQLHANFSPDGLLVAYSTNQSGTFEVHASTMKNDGHWPISINGGYEPRWRADGRELYYLSEDRKLMAVSVGVIPKGAGPSPFGIPKPLFPTGVSAAGVGWRRTHFVPSRDGQRFLINTHVGDPSPDPITVVLNWPALLKK
jgi:Tol biopolymer transport system component